MGILSPQQQERVLGALVVLLALALAVAGTRPSAGSFNDGSRLATVECLVDHHTLAIDESLYVNPTPEAPFAYAAHPPVLRKKGTLDKLFIKGHFYSDKPPLPALLLAGLYKTLQTFTGLRAGERPDEFYFCMTVCSCGLPYALAVWCIFRLGRVLGLSRGLRLGWTASFALATIALPYAEVANGHLPQLATAAAILLGLVTWTVDGQRWRPGLLLGIGFLAGLAYSIEQAAGGLLAAWTLLLVAYRSLRRDRLVASLAPCVLVGLGALPCALAHHYLIYSVAGTLRPANVFPQYFDYPGSLFTIKDLTGVYNHPSIVHFLAYAAGLLVGERGFVQYNLPLFLVPTAVVLLLRQHRQTAPAAPVAPSAGTPDRDRPTVRQLVPEVVFACGWSLCTWLVYALLSTNYSGTCCSIRWFVPLLAPAYFLLALALRELPILRYDFALLSVWGGILGIAMAWVGGWEAEVPGFWKIQAGALAAWLATSRLLPSGFDRLAQRLMVLGWPLLIAGSVAPLLLDRGRVDFLDTDNPVLLRAGEAILCLALGLIVGLRARVDRQAGSAEAWTTLGCAALAALLTAMHFLIVENNPTSWSWQRDLYLSLLNHTGGAPHQYRLLPYGLVRALEWMTHDYLFASLAYRWFFNFWLAWAWYRFVRLFHDSTRARLSLLVLLVLYPVSIACYFGQLTDPLSHTLLVLGLIYIVQDRPVSLALALALGIACKETAVLLVPVYLACHWRQGRRALEVTLALTGVAAAAFLLVRLPLGWRPSLEAINGVPRLMIGTNLGIGEPVAGSAVPLWVNYLHPILFVVPFLPFALRHWERIDPRLRAMALTLTPLLLASSLCFSWLYESRNYVPLLPVLVALALPPCAPVPTPLQRRNSERQAIGA